MTAVAPISSAKNAGPCEGTRHIADRKNTLVKWITTGLMKVRVPPWSLLLRKPVPSETATNRSASNVAPAVPTKT